MFATGRDGSPPAVTTRLSPVRAGAGRTVWQVEVIVPGEPAPADAGPAFESRVARRTKPGGRAAAGRRAGPGALPPSCPRGVESAVGPRLLPRARPPVVRRGDERLDPLIIFPPDGRRVYQDTRYPWRCVCAVQSGSSGGSGVLIGPRHVLTAAHVIDWRLRRAAVAANRFDRTNQGVSQVIAVHHYEEVDSVDGSTVDEDYVVLVLADRLGDRLGWLGARRYDSAWDNNGAGWWRSIGYAGDVAGGNRPVFQRGFDLDEDDLDLGSARALTTQTGDFAKQQSGSPIFAFWADGPYAVAVVSAQGGGYNWASAGSDLPALVADARAGDP